MRKRYNQEKALKGAYSAQRSPAGGQCVRDYEPSCGPPFEALVYIPPGAACVKPLPAGARPDPPPQPPPRLSPRLRAAGSRVRGPARVARCGGWRGRVPRGAWRDSVTSSSRQRPAEHRSPGTQVSGGHNSCCRVYLELFVTSPLCQY